MDGYATAADGTRIAFQVRGSGPPLVLLSGQSNSHRWWDAVRADFESTFTTVTLDHRGTGDSDKPDVPYSTEMFADDVAAVINAAVIGELDADRVDLYGTSMGGRIAQWVAVKHPHLVRTLVLGCTSPGGMHAVERGQDVRRSLAQADRAAADRALAELMFTPAWLAEHPGPHAVLGDPGMPAYARRRHLTASAQHDAWDVLPAIAAPTLVVHGADDRFNPTANAALIADRIPGAWMHLVPGARHAYFEEFRATASPLVLEFVTAAR
ncbi:alpha/beta fold hydrolase [Pseudonocardia sp. TRM90224]|uniref:alpha/beta fold hydrolase n=1 Tax=Pseudonocardia sp. TRM90224 TaxID=2812678 RepID=UPI001E654E52|nr:alpha/beta fold hydrolase [Pseudonocardia sp. TRM90224]